MVLRSASAESTVGSLLQPTSSGDGLIVTGIFAADDGTKMKTCMTLEASSCDQVDLL